MDYSELREKTDEDFLYHRELGCVPISECVQIGWGADDKTCVVPKALFDEITMWCEHGAIMGS
tara:strand:+ start:3727 stop:3915 length:189 start_codon:yes stop_codon:yes gene_type:complete